MGFEDYVSEIEAATFSGVSIATLHRFAEAGYLKVENDSDGLRLFSKSELKSVFGLDSFPRAAREAQSLDPLSRPQPQINREKRTISAEGTPERLVTESAETGKADSPKIKPARLTDSIEVIRIAEASANSTTQPEATPTASSPAADTARVALEQEISRLRSAYENQERLLELKDLQIKQSQEQCDWLKQRLEKLEDKAERDQLLLLAETQTIRRLINIQEQKKSPVRLALEWLGLAAPQPAQGTIEIGQSSQTPTAPKN